MPWHHIIPKHEWKRRFGNLKGVNAHDNLVNLTHPQHIQVHKLLYELNGIEFDRLAVLRMSGQIGNEELKREVFRLCGLSSKGRITSSETKQKQSEALIGRKRQPFTPSHVFNMSRAHLGMKHSSITKERMSIARKGKEQSVVTCPTCQVVGGTGNMKRYHFDNCKRKYLL